MGLDQFPKALAFTGAAVLGGTFLGKIWIVGDTSQNTNFLIRSNSPGIRIFRICLMMRALLNPTSRRYCTNYAWRISSSFPLTY
jgi:hypothetical protein